MQPMATAHGDSYRDRPTASPARRTAARFDPSCALALERVPDIALLYGEGDWSVTLVGMREPQCCAALGPASELGGVRREAACAAVGALKGGRHALVDCETVKVCLL